MGRVNRLKAHRAMALDDSSVKKKHSVFSQLQREMRGWSGATLRRGFVAKGHGGERRDLFVFALSPHDLSELCEPNNEVEMLSNEEQDLLNTFSSLAYKKNENSREIEEALAYLGKLVGTATRHGIPCDLPLPLGVVWKQLTEENVDIIDCLKEIDTLATQSMCLPIETILVIQRRLLNSFVEGMSSVLPVELLSMFTGEQLRDFVCGNSNIDVELLRRVVEYEGYNESDSIISFFWEVLREMTTSERKLFLQFVWARNRLPLKESGFDPPFKIQKDTKNIVNDGDYPLPSASTCFFSLTLPDYPTKEMLKQKLLFAVENVTTMESDYVTNDVEISEGWRGL